MRGELVEVQPRELGAIWLSDFGRTSPCHHLDLDQYERCLQGKLAECAPGFIRSIRKHGIQAPVMLYTDLRTPYGDLVPLMLRNGHHRWAVAYFSDLWCPALRGPELNWQDSQLVTFPTHTGRIERVFE